MKELVTDSSNPLQNITEFGGFGKRPFYSNGRKHQRSVKTEHIHNMYIALFFLIQVSAFSVALTVTTLLRLFVAILYFHNEKEF